MDSREKGAWGEETAARSLGRKGFRVIERNYRSRYGEIDIIAANDQYIVFVEVKLRKRGGMISPVEAVTPMKQRKIIRTALCYLTEFPTNLQPRFDIIEILEPEGGENSFCRLRQIENAFTWEDDNGIF